jgi:CRP-like cAMP-binding protein
LEVYCTIEKEDHVLDTLSLSGCVIGQYSILHNLNLTFSVRAKTEVKMLSLEMKDLTALADNPDFL